MHRTELQYNLQKARALATELRNTLEAIEGDGSDLGWDRTSGWEMDDYPSNLAGEIETWLDEIDSLLIGEGSVRITVEDQS